MADNNSPEQQSTPPKPSRLTRLLQWKFAIPLILSLAILLGPALFRQWRLSHVPDIGHPFPTDDLLKPIPEEENAYPLFKEAFTLYKEVPDAHSEEYFDEIENGWDPTDNILNKYLKANHPALEKWKEATEKENYQVQSVSHLTKAAGNTNRKASEQLARWSQREIERLVKIGKPEEALPWLRASFRSSSLVTRNAPWLDLYTGTVIFAISTSSAQEWMHHPDVTTGQLLRLFSIVQESQRLMEKPSTTVKMKYLISQYGYKTWSFEKMRKTYNLRKKNLPPVSCGPLPPVSSRWEAWLLAEPEFSRRLAVHWTANHLAFIDEPRRDRPPILEDSLFDESAVGLSPKNRLPAKTLINRSKKAKLFNSSFQFNGTISKRLGALDRQQARYACLQVALAAQAFYRDHGHFPQQLADLKPDYLSSLPDDPYAPKPNPVIYRRTGDEAVVYSRFKNGADDGGKTVTHEESPPGKDPNDFGIRLHPPKPIEK